MKTKIVGHPALSHILNLHLRDNAVMKSDFKLLTAQMATLTALVALAKSMADKAMTKAKKK